MSLIEDVYKPDAATNVGNKTLSMLLAKYNRIYSDPFPRSMSMPNSAPSG